MRISLQRRPREVEVDGVPLYGSGRARRAALRRKLLTAGAAVLVLVVGVGAFIVSGRNATTEVSLDQAVREFRQAAPAPPSPASVDHAGEAAASAGDGEVSPPTEPNPGGSASVEAPADAADPTDASPAAPNSYVLPAAGVYTYSARGGESVSLLNASHAYPDRIFATVRHLGGCRWEHRNQVIREHVDIRTLCSEEGRFLQLVQERQVEFFGQRDGAALVCEPAQVQHELGFEEGASHTDDCKDASGDGARMTRTYLGTEAITVGGTEIEAVRVRVDGDLYGGTTGTSTDHLWLHPETGLTLRWSRSVDSVANAYGAKIRYTEEADFALLSLQPQA